MSLTTYDEIIDGRYMSKITLRERLRIRDSAREDYRVLKSTDVSDMNRTQFQFWLDETLAAKNVSKYTMKKIKMVQDFVDEYGLAKGCLLGCPKSIYAMTNATDNLLRKSGWPSHARLAFSMACLQSEETDIKGKPIGFENYEIVEYLCLSVIDNIGVVE